MDRKVNVSSLKIGMYVSNLDRPWIDTPFLLEGFLIRDKEDISIFHKYCVYVFIDTDLGLSAPVYIEEAPRVKTDNHVDAYLQGEKKQIEYINTRTTKEELPKAQIAMKCANTLVTDIMEDVKQGKKLDIQKVEGVVVPILDSIVRNSEAYLWLMMMQKKNATTYTHSVENCALAVAFGRHMGLPKKDLKTLSIGLLMMDVGNMRVPEEILNKKGRLTEDEYAQVKKHVEHGVQILKETPGMNEDIINIALNHHEHFDGSGYPAALLKTQIHVYGRIAAIIDCYDAMTSTSQFNDAKSAYVALQNIYNSRGSAFQPELVEQFLQCMGVYPTGSLIEMTNGAVGVVLAQNTMQRMRPKIMLILDTDKSHLKEYKEIDLTKQYEDSSGSPLNIQRGLEPDTYGLDPTELYL